MKVKALTDFYDKAEGKQRREGQEFTCSDERGKFLAGIGYVEVCAEKAPERRVAASKAIPEADEDED